MLSIEVELLNTELSDYLQHVENGEDIQLTRNGQPFAVPVSFNRYQKMGSPNTQPKQGIFKAYQRWRKQYPTGIAFTALEEAEMYQRTRN